MGSIFRGIPQLGPAGLVLKAIIGSFLGIGLLLAFILGRRTYRRRYFQRRDARMFALRDQWEDIVSRAVPLDTWRFDPLDREIVEAILLDSLEVPPTGHAPRLLSFLRSSGLLDIRIHEARTSQGWRRQRALATLGRTRAPEAIPVLAEGLDDPDLETRVAAVRGLGRTGLPEAGVRLVEWVADVGLQVPAPPLQNALLSCCRSRPALLVPHLRRAEGNIRQLLARILAELATPDLEDDLLLLAGDPLAEVRASAARALAEAKPESALPILFELAGDPEWFVRLRAVIALGALENPRAIPGLIRALCDANRYVRLRAAAALVRLEPHLQQILQQVVETQDRYALQTMISELDRSGAFPKLMDALTDPGQRHAAAEILLDALRTGTQQLREARPTALKPEEVSG
jgi:HEAT repeat protein